MIPNSDVGLGNKCESSILLSSTFHKPYKGEQSSREMDRDKVKRGISYWEWWGVSQRSGWFLARRNRAAGFPWSLNSPLPPIYSVTEDIEKHRKTRRAARNALEITEWKILPGGWREGGENRAQTFAFASSTENAMLCTDKHRIGSPDYHPSNPSLSFRDLVWGRNEPFPV